ncbi:hypothetical protein [Roseococcus microcysteis]|uniref:hypothetical protein n=1 Tax=Roseococcus microcysteis TaxID=2771361 RepID=UPI00168B6CD7|nr:hypothetical protein [Roseococcus microcysteis]
MTLPLQQAAVLKGQAWLRAHFEAALQTAVQGTPATVPMLCAIALIETHNIWLGRIGKHSPETLLRCCVGDASGDVQGHPRSAFPTNTAAFRERFGDEFTEMLIGEANAARALRGLPPSNMVYKGYGIFQYDLQYVLKDPDFFRERQWYSMEACARKAVQELVVKFKASGGEVRGALRRYNGSGKKAEAYADVAMQFLAWCEGAG